jgi:hypothetical protein
MMINYDNNYYVTVFLNKIINANTNITLYYYLNNQQ